MSRSVVVGFFVFLALFFTGCGSVNKQVTLPDSELTKDKNKAYIVFTRPSLEDSGVETEIMEFDDKSYDMKFVGNLSAGNKFIYPVNEGEHYFFLNGEEDDDLIKIEAEAGKRYVVKVVVDQDAATEKLLFVPVTKSASSKDISSSNLDLSKLKTVEPTEESRTDFIESQNEYKNDLQIEHSKWLSIGGTRMTVDQGLPTIRF